MNLLYALFALDILNLAVFLPVFGAFIRSLGGTPFTLGLINSSSALVSFLWNPIVGSLSDQVGRKGLLLKCLLASSVGSLILAVSSSSLLLVFLGRIIGAFGSPTAILLRSIVADSYKTAEDKKVFFNKCAPFMSVAFLCGTLSSGFLSEAKNGFVMAFLLMAAITGFSAFLATTTLSNDTKQDKNQENEEQTILQKGVKELKKAAIDIRSISWPRYKNLFIIKANYDFGITMLTSNIGLILLNEFNVTGRYMGYVFLMISVISIISNIFKLKLKTLFDNISDKQMIVKGGLVLIVSFIGMSLSGVVYGFLFFLGCMCIAKAFLDTTLQEMIGTQTTQDDRGKVIGAFENLMPLAAFVVPVLSGSLAEILGERIIICSAMIPLSIAVFVANNDRTKKD